MLVPTRFRAATQVPAQLDHFDLASARALFSTRAYQAT
jgi:hypothetical protein